MPKTTKSAAKTTKSKTKTTPAARSVAPPPARPHKPSPAHEVLPSSKLQTAELTDIGARFSTSNLVNHAHAVLAKVGAYDFAPFGFDLVWRRAMTSLLGAIDDAEHSAQAARDALSPSGTALDQAIADCKSWKRRAMTTITIAPKLKAKAKPMAVGSSAAKLGQSMRALFALVGSADAEPFGGGAAMKAQGNALLTKLSSAREAHTAALARMSPELRAVNHKKGILYEELRRIARAARLVAPAESHLFAVTQHVRTHRARPAKKANGASVAASAPQLPSHA